jgi:hypothetical protein
MDYGQAHAAPFDKDQAKPGTAVYLIFGFGYQANRALERSKVELCIPAGKLAAIFLLKSKSDS